MAEQDRLPVRGYPQVRIPANPA